MDLVQSEYRAKVLQERSKAIKACSEGFDKGLRVYGTSIWDQSLYKAWGRIVNSLVPQLDVIERYLEGLAREVNAEEVVLFERATFLTVTSVVGDVGEGNPYSDRYERLSNVIKTFKHSLSYVPAFAPHSFYLATLTRPLIANVPTGTIPPPPQPPTLLPNSSSKLAASTSSSPGSPPTLMSSLSIRLARRNWIVRD